MKKYINNICNTPLLSSFSLKEIQNLIDTKSLIVKQYDKNEIIHFDGDKCSNLEILISGNISIERIAENGDLLTISKFSDGDILGGNLLFSSSPYYLMTVISENRTTVVEIPKHILINLLNTKEEFLLAYLEFISDLAIVLGNVIKASVKQSLRIGILNYLKLEYKRQNSSTILLNTTKKALADKLGVQRTSLSRELKKMSDEGIITCNKNIITIVNSNELFD